MRVCVCVCVCVCVSVYRLISLKCRELRMINSEVTAIWAEGDNLMFGID